MEEATVRSLLKNKKICPTQDAVQGFDLTFTHKKIGDGFIVSKELMEDDLFGVIARKPADLADSMKRKVEYDAAVILNNANSTTFNTGADGVALAATNHPREDGGTAQSNKITTALNETTLNTILVNVAGILDGKGQKALIMPDYLVVPNALEMTARILMDTTGRVGGNLNDVNIFKGRLEIFVYPWLTDSNNYFVIDRRLNKKNGLTFYWRAPIAVERDDKVSNDYLQ